jgi:hypothetical protein
MTRGTLRVGAILALLMASVAGAYADDPTGVLLQERGLAPIYPGPGPLPAFIDAGPCFQGMHSVSFPTPQGYRCVRD